MARTCSIYGLGLAVNVPIAGLKGLDAAESIDVSMTLGSLPERFGDERGASREPVYVTESWNGEGHPPVRVERVGGGSHYRFAYSDGTRIVVDADGDAVWATTPEGATIEDTATYLLGPTLGFVLRLRGITCLHASAIAVDDRAIAFVGPAGAGKSSTAAAFARAGFPVLTDDVAPLRDQGTRFEVQPAYPRLRLWPDSAESLFGSPDALPRITPTWDKRYLDLNGPRYRFMRAPRVLGAVYVLGERIERDAPRIEALDAKAALMALVAETYSTRLIPASLRAKEFDVLARLVEHVPVRRVHACADFGRVDELCAAILNDFREVASGAGR